jgi:hypothetical protein
MLNSSDNANANNSSDHGNDRSQNGHNSRGYGTNDNSSDNNENSSDNANANNSSDHVSTLFSASTEIVHRWTTIPGSHFKSLQTILRTFKLCQKHFCF